LKRLNARRVKIHRNYTVDEAARLLKVHKNTICAWIRSGLPTIDDRRPVLILGRELASFLHGRRERARQHCRSGQLYCLRCRAPKHPAARRADYLPITSRSGNLRGRCPTCHALMHRLVSLGNLKVVSGGLAVQVAPAQQRIGDCSDPSLNSDLAAEADTYANTQS
jgi:excisionase family DNA binding protein